MRRGTAAVRREGAADLRTDTAERGGADLVGSAPLSVALRAAYDPARKGGIVPGDRLPPEPRPAVPVGCQSEAGTLENASANGQTPVVTLPDSPLERRVCVTAPAAWQVPGCSV